MTVHCSPSVTSAPRSRRLSYEKYFSFSRLNRHLASCMATRKIRMHPLSPHPTAPQARKTNDTRANVHQHQPAEGDKLHFSFSTNFPRFHCPFPTPQPSFFRRPLRARVRTCTDMLTFVSARPRFLSMHVAVFFLGLSSVSRTGGIRNARFSKFPILGEEKGVAFLFEILVSGERNLRSFLNLLSVGAKIYHPSKKCKCDTKKKKK